MRSGLGGRCYLRPTQGTLRVSRTPHGCLHPHDQRVETQSTLDVISDVETLASSTAPKRPRDTSFRSRRAVSFKCVYLGAQSARY